MILNFERTRFTNHIFFYIMHHSNNTVTSHQNIKLTNNQHLNTCLLRSIPINSTLISKNRIGKTYQRVNNKYIGWELNLELYNLRYCRLRGAECVNILLTDHMESELKMTATSHYTQDGLVYRWNFI